jgi:chromosome partitioning protein
MILMDNDSCRIIAVVNHKGGVGKTTTTINLGTALAKLKKKVLLIDMDPGAHATYGLGILAHRRERTVYDLMRGRAPVAEIKVEIALDQENLDLVPASIELAEAEVQLSGLPGREFLLKEALDDVPSYDFIFIDCPPSLAVLTLNAMVAAKEVFIPLQTEYLAMQGLGKLLETVKIVKHRLNPDLEITGVLATRFDKRKILNREVVNRIKEHFGDKVFDVQIRENISLAESPSHGLTIFEYFPGSYGAEDYMALAKEVLNRGKNGRKEKTRSTGSARLD